MRESVQTRHYHLQALIHWGQFLVNISLWTNKTNVNINSAANKFLFEVKNTIHRRKYLVIETDRKYSTYMRFNNLFSFDSLRFRRNHREPDRVFHIYSILQKIFVVNLKKKQSQTRFHLNFNMFYIFLILISTRTVIKGKLC